MLDLERSRTSMLLEPDDAFRPYKKIDSLLYENIILAITPLTDVNYKVIDSFTQPNNVSIQIDDRRNGVGSLITEERLFSGFLTASLGLRNTMRTQHHDEETIMHVVDSHIRFAAGAIASGTESQVTILKERLEGLPTDKLAKVVESHIGFAADAIKPAMNAYKMRAQGMI